MASTALSTISVVTTDSTLSLGSREMLAREPRYCSVYPFRRPHPITSLTVSPDTPSSSRASCTSCRRSGRMIASIFRIMVLVLLGSGGHPQWDRPRHGPAGRGRGRVVLGARHRHELLRV